jgi:hypothetical protein
VKLDIYLLTYVNERGGGWVGGGGLIGVRDKNIARARRERVREMKNGESERERE